MNKKIHNKIIDIIEEDSCWGDDLIKITHLTLCEMLKLEGCENKIIRNYIKQMRENFDDDFKRFKA
jgi:hypothetical protein